TFRWSLFLADEPREFVGEFERDLLRRIALDRGTRGQRGLRELAINRPRQVDPTPKGLVDRSDRPGRHARQQGVRREFGVLSHHGPARHDRSGTDHRTTVDRRVHADEAVVSDGAAMDDRRMADGHASADHRAIACALPTSCVHTPAARPYTVSFALAIASSRSSKCHAATTGPKTSSRATRAAAGGSSKTVGFTKFPSFSSPASVRPPPARSFAPFPMPSSIAATTFVACSRETSGPI